jgi:putative endonuclease
MSSRVRSRRLRIEGPTRLASLAQGRFCGEVEQACYPGPAVSQYYVYIMASRSGVLYTGITSDLNKRVGEHKQGLIPGFTKRYKVHRLVYYESTSDVNAAIAREKQIKKWRREKKVKLIEALNRDWNDLAREIAPF